ncbi:MAG: AAA family ATPase [Candidatus Omnitrophica bacterium]|nr:AAA family ATPase [Candidatus Omnitrophota bacterium]
MAEYGLNLWDYWRIIYKRRWIILSVFLVSLASSQFFGQKTDPIYRSNITLFVGSGNTPLAEVTGSGVTFWGGGSGQNLATQLELLKSYSILREVALEMGMITPDADEEDSQDAVSSLRGKITVEDQEGTDLVVLAAVDADPERAKDIVTTLADVFIRKSWERKVQEATSTKRFIEKQLAQLEASAVDIKRKLKAIGIAAGPLPGAETYEPGGMDMDLRTRLIQLRYELMSLQTRYTDNYPGITSIKSEIAQIEGYLKKEGEGSEVKEAEKVKVGTLDPDRLKNELVINEKIYEMLKERYERALLTEASKTKDIEVVNPAVLPKSPIMEMTRINVFLGGVIGLILGLVAAFITESLDTSIGTIDDVEEYLRMPVLGVIPSIEVSKKENVDYWKEPPPPEEQKRYAEIMGRLVTQYKPKSPIAEAYRNLQTYIKFSGLDKFGNCLMFTSAGIREGKTITSVNSALSMAQLGYKVLLIDADLRRPSVHKVFGIERDIGLTDVILGTFKMDDVVKTMDDIMMGNIKSSVIMSTYGMENLHVMTAGHMVANPTEILSSQTLAQFIKEAKSKFQVVFFDTAPILPVTDSCILSSKTDGVILVYEVGRVSRGALRRAKMQIENAKGKPIGVVLNSMRASDMRFGSPFYYYYQKYYGEEQTPKEEKPLAQRMKFWEK